MVFCGKPSGGCHACRERKTKCDQNPEGCMQCKRAKRKCPGYRIQGDLIFRDQSSNVIRKFKAKEARIKQAALINATPPSATSEDVNGSEGPLEIVQQHESSLPIYALAPTIEDRATGFFITHYVLGMSGPSMGHLEYLTDISRTQILDDCLVYSMRAAGFASYAHAVRAPTLLKNARYQYLRALQSTNAALRDPVDVKKDTTLLAIMILGIYETVTGCNQRSLKDWAEHLNGAAEVIRLRGPNQIYYPAGRHMLVQVTAQLLVVCMQRGVALPEHIREYVTAAYNFVPTPMPGFVINYTMLLFSDLRASILDRSLTDQQVMLSRALELDSILLDMVVNVPTGWEYETVFTNEVSEFVYNGQYHIYYDHWIAQMWNTLRCLRILLNEMIRNVLLEGFSSKPPLFIRTEHAAQFQISTDVMYDMQADILRSVPQHIAYFPKPASNTQGDGSLYSRNISIADEAFAPHRMSGGTFLIWPLWFAGGLDTATDEVREFVVNNLRSIGSTMGIQQANVLAEIVRSRAELKVWKEG